MMGGVVSDLHARSTVPGLLAVGEAACTGLHGANRLASNSLSECFVFGARAARTALDEPEPGELAPPPRPPPLQPPEPATRTALWRDAGSRVRARPRGAGRRPPPLARLVAACALARAESRGAHNREDLPRLDPALDGHHVVVGADEVPHLERWD